MMLERAWFLSEGEKSESGMGARFPRRGKGASDELPSPHRCHGKRITSFLVLPLNGMFAKMNES